MNNTEFVIEQNKDVYLFSTEVENLMINEFFTSANGDYVKVYLLGLMHFLMLLVIVLLMMYKLVLQMLLCTLFLLI